MDHEMSSDDFVRYVDVTKEYFRKRELRKGVNGLLLWGLAVAATMFGHLFGWNVGLVAGGFWGMVIATLLVALMYVGLVFSIAELSAALPHTGGFYSFTRYAFGPLGGFLCGTAQAIQYLLMPAVIVGWQADYLSPIWPGIPLELWWLVLYAIFVLINILSTRLTLLITFLLALLAISFLSFFYVSVWITGAFEIEALLTVLPQQNQSALLPKGWAGIFAALPFAIWFYLPLDLISLLAEETDDVQSRVPKALKSSLAILLPLSFLTLVATSGVGGGVALIGMSQRALLDGLQPILAQMNPVVGVMPILVGGSLVLACSAALSITLAYSRVLFALSRAGYFPNWLSLTGRYQTPERALIWGAVVGLLSLYLIRESSLSSATLANMVLFAAMLSYACVMASYLKLKQEDTDPLLLGTGLPRPYASPLGSWGAAIALLGAMSTLVTSFLNPGLRSGAYGVTLFLLAAIFYFLFVSSQRLIAQAPEEKLAPNYETDTTARGIANKILVVLLSVAATYAFIRFGLASFASPCPPDCMDTNLFLEDLSEADFRDTNFVFGHLRQADLSGADLRRADFSGAKLIQATLANANLSDAKFIGANLSEANLEGAILSITDMSGASLQRSNLTHLDLTETTLKGVNLREAKLIGSNLARVNLAGIEFTSAHMKGANLAGANLAGSTLSDAELLGADLRGADLAGAWLNKSNLTGANLTGADLSGASLIGANLTSAQLDNVQLVGANLIGAILVGTSLRGANLKAVRWKNSELTKRDLSEDSTLANLNELQLNALRKDAKVLAIKSDSQTIWPSEAFRVLELTSSERGKILVEQKEEDPPTKKPINGIKVGLLHSHTGPLGISESSVRDGTLLAIDEINAAGGVLGQPLIPVIKDGASVEAIFREKARQLLEEEKVTVVFGGSRTRQALVPIFEELNGLLFYPLSNEGFEQSPNIFYLGADPTQQIIPGASYLLDEGHQNIFLLGSDDPFSHRSHDIIRALLSSTDATVMGEEYVPLDQTDFSDIIREMQAGTQLDAIINTMGGLAAVNFFKEFDNKSLTSQKITVMNISLSETEMAQLYLKNIAGELTTWSYYQTLASVQNDAFVTAYKKAYGSEYPTSDPIHAGYFGVYLWKEMAEAAESISVDAIRKAAASGEIQIQAPGGLIRLDGQSQHLYKTVRIGIVREDGLIEEIESFAQSLKPDPFLREYEWANELFEDAQE